MEEELAALKRILISLVVSSPTTMTVNNLVKDYRNMVGGQLPVSKFGYKDYITFLKERCLDIFVVEGSSRDPILTPKVTKNLKHIDQMVQKQKVQSSIKYKGKRRSVPVAVNTPPNPPPSTNLVCETFKGNSVHPPPNNYNKPSIYRETTPIHRVEPKVSPIKEINVPNPLLIETTNHNGYKHVEIVDPCDFNGNEDTDNINNSNALSKFYKKRLPRYTSEMDLQGNDVDGSSKGSNDSGAHSSGSSTSRLEEMKNEIVELIRDSPEGVWFTDLMRLYKERYGRELSLHRFGHTSLGNLVSSLQDRVAVTRPDPLGDYLLRDPASAAAARRGRGLALPLRRSARHPSTRDLATNPDDALPGIEIDADVYPADCMHYLEVIPSADISALSGGSQLEVLIGEVYSPSHFWLQQVGPEHNLAMEAIMDRMNEHYVTDARELVPGAVRVGQYCAALYEKDWHRSLIVQVVDSDTVKVRHVDYGTVDTVATCSLRYLPREFGQLHAQSVRARLAACRPSARGQRWPHAAATDFLRAVRDKRLYANIVAVDREEDIVETFLTDTSGATDVCLTRALVKLGHADPRHDSALARDESYLYPRFDALESGSTPNYADIRRLLNDGIELDFVDAYRRYVPAPSAAPVTPPAPSPPPMELVNRVPLLRLESPPPAASDTPDLSPTPQFLSSQPSLSQHQMTQSLYQSAQPQHQMAQPLYQSAQPQHQMAQNLYQSAQPQHQMGQPLYQSAQPQHQIAQPLYQSAQPQHQMTQPQFQSGQDFLSQFQKMPVRDVSQYQTSQPPISQYQTTQSQYQTTQSQYQTTQSQYQTTQSQCQTTQSQYQTTQSQYQTTQSQCQTTQTQYQTTQSQCQTTQSQYQTTQSQYQTAQALLLQLQNSQSSHYPTRQPPSSQVQTTQSAIFQPRSQCNGTQSSQYPQTHSQLQPMFSLLQSQSVQNSTSQLQSVQPCSKMQMHPSLQQSQMLHPSSRQSPHPTLPQPPMQRPVHPPLAPSQAVHPSVAQTRSSRPFILPTLPVRPRQLPTPPLVRSTLLPTAPPFEPSLKPTVRPTSSPTPPLARTFQPTAPRVPPPLGSAPPPSSAPVQPPRSSTPAEPLPPSEPALPTAPPGFNSPVAVPPPALNEVRLTEGEWSVLAHLRATDPVAAEWFLTVTAWRAVTAHRHAPAPRMPPFDSKPAGESGGRLTVATDDN